ncbi:ImmA/IrrE family metallo-endopeptidase (plasmid) [Clostridium taeniosporum]|uniref:ImmA/IrrE family metallo-endopeptidase n=1 Tax=Clostridium taeniosporum TaxID=394958 RepID=A0A1D7XP96_9CLOT|nr:ImmA/IrrE family metallo-endopeptidase [Clostridium taeniosporum]
MDDLKSLAYEQAINFRDKHSLGNYCAKQLIEIIDLLQITERVPIKIIRTVFDNENLSGFIGFKKGTFIIVTNTNHKLGSERFTIAHEICHLINNRTSIKKNPIIEVLSCDNNDPKEIRANAFAAELLMPKDDIKEQLNTLTKNMNKDITSSIIVQLQQKYGVSYIAITKRLNEIGVIDNKKQKELEEIDFDSSALENLTKNLGYTNELNVPSKEMYISPKDLENIKVNYEKCHTTYDDLVRIFSYLGCGPEKFGYENNLQITDNAIEFMKSLSK